MLIQNLERAAHARAKPGWNLRFEYTNRQSYNNSWADTTIP